MSIKKATEYDLLEILALQRRAFLPIATLLGSTDIQPLNQDYLDIVDEYLESTVLIYTIDNKIVGSVRAYQDTNNNCHIGKLIVDPEYQNKGIGGALMTQIEKEFPSSKKYQLFTGEITPNTLHLYSKLGYKEISRTEDKIRMIIMEKENEKTKDFTTPPNHVNFLAKKLFGNCGEIENVSIAYLAPNGGGPKEPHTHEHDHLFIVVEGEAKVILNKNTHIISKNESFVVKGNIPHSVWNNVDETTVMIGITIKN